MSCRALDLFHLISPSYGDGGLCPADGVNFSAAQKQQLLNELNKVIPALMKRIDAKGTLARWNVPVQGGCFCLPVDCVDVRQAFLNGCSLDIRDQWYEGRIGYRLNGGSGIWCGSADLIDVGDGYAIPEEWPSNHFDTRYGVMAEELSDVGKIVHVKFKDRYGNAGEEFLELLPHQQVTSTQSAISDITYQYKGITNGAVVGFIVYNTGVTSRMVRIPANVAAPSFHKKKLPISFGACSGELSIIGKMRFIPLQSEYDTLPICDPMALSFGLQAVSALNRRDPQGYNTALTLAVNELDKELQDVHPDSAVTQIQIRPAIRFPRKCFT